MYEYRVEVLKVIDGDTVDVDIDLGFGVWLKNERVRLYGIDTPESRTRDLEEKKFGLAAKERLKELLKDDVYLRTMVGRGGEDMKGKFGRILGDFVAQYEQGNGWHQMTATQILIKEGHAVAYNGQSKDDIQEAHMKNRTKLLEEGIVT
jgi:micrococcal nuclease|tara:strand:+ start:147 stop:593 length:447 start_codon:yes stop_codon:yes gene_type:complete